MGGIIGSAGDVPKVACPLHKKQFSLEEGSEVNGGDLQILTFPVKIEKDEVLVELPAPEEIDALLGTTGLRVTASEWIERTGDAGKVPLKPRPRTAVGNNTIVG